MIDMDQEVKSILERMVETFIMLNMPNMVTGALVLVGAMEHLDTMERLVDKTAERVSELEQEVMSLETSELDLESRVMELETEVSDLEETIFDLEQDIVGLEAEVSDAK
jgi:chromosome segregation ATPase